MSNLPLPTPTWDLYENIFRNRFTDSLKEHLKLFFEIMG